MADPKSVGGLPFPRRNWALAAIWLAMAMAVIDASIANVALPAIARDLHSDPASSVWIVNAYQMAIVVSLLPLAALGEIIAYRRVFLAGLVVFTLASIACALSPNLPILGAARTLQGLGAAGLMSVSSALLRYTLPADRLGRGVGLNALVISIAAVLGPTIASAILSVGSWPLLFWVNAPLGVPAVLIAMRALPHSPRSIRRLDWIAAGLNVLAFGLIFTGVDILTRERLPLVGGGVILLGTLAGGLLVRRSIGQTQPLLPLDLMARPLFALTVLTSIASFAAQMLAFVALPFFFQGTLHKTQVETGVLVTPWPIAVGVAAPLAGRLADRFPAAILSFVGLGCLALGLGLIAFLTPSASTFDIVWRMALCGLGFGFFQAPNNRTLILAAPMERTGAAGGMLATARLTGQTVGATAAAALFSFGSSGSKNALVLGASFAAAASIVSISRVGGSPGNNIQNSKKKTS